MGYSTRIAYKIEHCLICNAASNPIWPPDLQIYDIQIKTYFLHKMPSQNLDSPVPVAVVKLLHTYPAQKTQLNQLE